MQLSGYGLECFLCKFTYNQLDINKGTIKKGDANGLFDHGITAKSVICVNFILANLSFPGANR